jgi:hypothetical protein
MSDYERRKHAIQADTCPVCGWPLAFPDLSVGEAYKKCMAIHAEIEKKEEVKTNEA